MHRLVRAFPALRWNKYQNLACRPIYLSRSMRFPTMWYVRPAKPQISLPIHTVWSEPLQVAWIFYDCWATDWTSFGVSKLQRRLHRLVWVYTCWNTTLLEITCHCLFHYYEPCHKKICLHGLQPGKSKTKHCEYEDKQPWFAELQHIQKIQVVSCQ